jgi:alginate O-acetyltransferase complex protein AlgI
VSFLSIAFVVFVAITFIAFHLAPARSRPQVLLATSLAFYATHGLGYLILLVTVALSTYGAAILIERAAAETGKKRVLIGAVSALIVLLCTFKLAGALALPPEAAQAMQADAVWRFVLPIGLSYYLFKLISYLLEVYWENIPAQRNWVSVGVYAAFFPQIVSGPIQRPGDFFTQLAHVGHVDPEDLTIGLRRILFGLFKKIAIADRLGPVVAAIHGSPEAHSQLELLFGAYAYAVQLYADFSGLTDIALGIGLLFGIKGPENFALPFFARNLQEYWRRWHMSLTSWLADYLFTPLRMALRDHGQFGLAAALFLNMVAVGIWHGFTGPYLAFGVFHGVALATSFLTLKRRDQLFKGRPELARIRRIGAPLVTFHLVVLGLILFRAESLSQAVRYLSSMIAGSDHPGISPLRFELAEMPLKLLVSLAVLVGLMEAVHAAIRSATWSERYVASPRALRWAVYYGLIIVILAFSRLGEGGFIYGQF